MWSFLHGLIWVAQLTPQQGLLSTSIRYPGGDLISTNEHCSLNSCVPANEITPEIGDGTLKHSTNKVSLFRTLWTLCRKVENFSNVIILRCTTSSLPLYMGQCHHGIVYKKFGRLILIINVFFSISLFHNIFLASS